MFIINDSKSENYKVFEAFTNDSKKFEIIMKNVIEMKKLKLQMTLIEESKKKIYCSLYCIESLKHIKVLSPYDSIEEIFQQICDYIDTNKKLQIKSSITIHSNKIILAIPINSSKYKQLDFELRYEDSELIEILLDTVDKLVKKIEDFEKRISALEEKVYSRNKEDKETKKQNSDFNYKIENLANVKTLKPHNSYISNIILLQNDKIAKSSLDCYIKIYFF